MTIQNPYATPQPWQEALDPQLLRRLLSRALQPGVSSTQLAAAIMARMQSMVPCLSLLAELTQRYGKETVQAEQLPIVYALPPHAHNKQTGAVSAAESRPQQWNMTMQASRYSDVVVEAPQPLVVQAKSDDTRGPREREARLLSLNVRQVGAVTGPQLQAGDAGETRRPLVVVEALRAERPSFAAIPPLLDDARGPREREARSLSLNVTQVGAVTGPQLQAGDAGETRRPLVVVEAPRTERPSFAVIPPRVTAARQGLRQDTPAAPVPRPVVRPTLYLSRMMRIMRIMRDSIDSAPRGAWQHLGLAQPVRPGEYVNGRLPTGVDHAPDTRPPVTSWPVVSETRRPSPQPAPVPLTVGAPIGQPDGNHPLTASRLDEPAIGMDMPLRVQANETTVGQRQLPSLQSTPSDSVAPPPPVTSARNGGAHGLDLNTLVEKVQSELDIGKLAERVQRQLRRRLVVERERRGGG